MINEVDDKNHIDCDVDLFQMTQTSPNVELIIQKKVVKSKDVLQDNARTTLMKELIKKDADLLVREHNIIEHKHKLDNLLSLG